LYDPLGEHLAGIVWGVLLQQPAQELPAARDREADRECELGRERSGDPPAVLFSFCSRQGSSGGGR
jgi:hypothetical protein